MRNAAVFIFVIGFGLLRAADPKTLIQWTAGHTQELDKAAASRLNKEAGLGTSRLMDSAFILYREGNSQAEIHTEQADFIFFREGAGAMIIGGKVVNGKPSGAGEIRGDSIEGGTKYPVKAGQHFTATIVKITPKE